MVRYGLAKAVTGVTDLHSRKKLLMILKTYSCKDLQAILKNLR